MFRVGQDHIHIYIMHIWCFWQGNQKHTVIYGANIQLWPTLCMFAQVRNGR
jgi:hypothetical protein